MRSEELDRAFSPTPQIFTDRVDDTLHALKEDVPMKRLTLRTAMIAAFIVLLLCGMAYAVIAMQGQEWYYQNRFTAYQEQEPDKQQAIIENLQTEVPQQPGGNAQELLAVTVQDYAWVQEQGLFTMSIVARAKDTDNYELYALWDLDVDGSYGSEIDPDDPDSRTEHWLWTHKGYGPPKTVMNDPSKRLLLVDFMDYNVFIGDTDERMPSHSFDNFIGEDGASICVMEFDLNELDVAAIEANYARQLAQETALVSSGEYSILRPGDEGEAVTRLQQRLSDLEYYNGNIDGAYTNEVQLCLASFQRQNGLADDDIAGETTQQCLYADGAITATGEEAGAYNASQADKEAQQEARASLLEHRDWLLNRADKMNAAIAQSTDAEGWLTLRMDYKVYEYIDDEIVLLSEGIAVFKVQTR